MFDVISEFSRTHCIAICAFLVPANLLATLQTLVFTFGGYSRDRVRLMATVASCYAVAIAAHVICWLLEGVVMAPTYILFFLATVCLTLNFGAIAYRRLPRLYWSRNFS
jgi:hypothetical protein